MNDSLFMVKYHSLLLQEPSYTWTRLLLIQCGIQNKEITKKDAMLKTKK